MDKCPDQVGRQPLNHRQTRRGVDGDWVKTRQLRQSQKQRDSKERPTNARHRTDEATCKPNERR
jgi:hypothetical protein